MAELVKDVHVPYSGAVYCPFCGRGLEFFAVVDLVNTSADHRGTVGLDPVIVVNVDTKIKSFKVEHECKYKEPKRS